MENDIDFFSDEEKEQPTGTETLPKPSAPVTQPEQIANFWRQPIRHALDDLCFDIYFINPQGGWSRVEYPDTPSGRAMPPFTEEEIISFGKGPGRYIFRPRSIKQNKIVKGAETHYLGDIHGEKEKEKEQVNYQPIATSQPNNNEMFIEVLKAQNQTLNNILMMILKTMVERPQNSQPQDLPGMLSAIMKVLSTVEKGKSDVEMKNIEVQGRLEEQRLRMQENLNALRLKQGKTPVDEEKIRELEEELRRAQTQPRQNWQEAISQILSNGTKFLENLIPLVNTLNQMNSANKGNAQSQNQSPWSYTEPYYPYDFTEDEGQEVIQGEKVQNEGENKKEVKENGNKVIGEIIGQEGTD